MKKVSYWVTQNIYLLIIIGFATFLRFYKLDHQSMWVDELFSANLSSPHLSFSEVLGNFKKTAHPPFYFILLYLFAKIFGGTSLALKSLSAIIGILGVLSIYKLGKELLNKNIGLIAATLLSFNYFHIYYSQEARMYALFFLLATWSFYLLVKFIKEPSAKRALFFGICTMLVVNTHYFGLLVLGTQIVLLLYFTLFPFSITRINFLKYCSISGIVIFLSYLPVFKVLEGHSKTKSLWIPEITYDSLHEVFRSFFGKSEVVVVLIVLLILLFLVRISKINDTNSFLINPIKDKWTFTTILIITWLIVGLLIPVYRSNAKVPIIIDRYFIHLLTPILLMCAIGLYSISNRLLRNGFLLIVILFSIINIFYVRWHYKGIYKSQFRETCEYVEKNKKEETKIVSALGRHLTYYLPQDSITELPLSYYLDEIKSDTTIIQDFWYIDGHTNVFSPTPKEQQFLNKHFYVKDSISLYDAWAKYFVKKDD